jgi:hypothetical protein
MPDSLAAVVYGAALFALIFLALALVSARRRRWLRLTGHVVIALLFLALAGLFGTVGIAVQGYRALTHEEVAAVITTEPLGPQQFRASFRFADNREATFNLSGDALYVDGHVLKWKPIGNFFGLHTAYELDRVAGRYEKLEEEQGRPRTVQRLSADKPVDMFNLRQRYAILAPLLDAEYGSATFVPAGEPQRYELRVSTSGFLMRRIEPPPARAD